MKSFLTDFTVTTAAAAEKEEEAITVTELFSWLLRNVQLFFSVSLFLSLSLSLSLFLVLQTDRQTDRQTSLVYYRICGNAEESSCLAEL